MWGNPTLFQREYNFLFFPQNGCKKVSQLVLMFYIFFIFFSYACEKCFLVKVVLFCVEVIKVFLVRFSLAVLDNCFQLKKIHLLRENLDSLFWLFQWAGGVVFYWLRERLRKKACQDSFKDKSPSVNIFHL